MARKFNFDHLANLEMSQWRIDEMWAEAAASVTKDQALSPLVEGQARAPLIGGQARTEREWAAAMAPYAPQGAA